MSFLKTAGMLVIILALLGGTNFYLARRVCRCIRLIFPRLPFAAVFAFFLVMTAMMFLSISRPFGGMVQQVISFVGACWMGVFAYLLLFSLAADLVALIAHFLPDGTAQKLRLAARTGAVVLALATAVYGYCHANRLYTVHYDIRLSQQPASHMNVVMLSDVHLGAVNSEARLEKIVERINALGPDLVCIAGDFFDSDYGAIADPEKAIRLLKNIQSTYGVYACLGNHDAGGTYSQMKQFLDQAGIQLLKDSYAVIDERLILAGRLDPSPIGGYADDRRQALSAVLAGADPELPVVVMDHNPINVGTYNGEVALVLSGHTHRGQIFPGGLVTGAMYTVDYGYFRADNGTQAIVTSGAGTWGLPMRVGTDCEIVQIDLAF
jgi:predicted MPP superfamily phosphohydrolase